MNGWHGRYLRVDVGSGATDLRAIPVEVLERFIGGVGLGTWICLAEGGTGHDPLEPAAPIVFCSSPLAGTPLTTSAKYAVVARSPLTGFLSDAISSSHFAIALKRTGYDALVLVGRAPRLTRILIDGDSVTLEGAGELGGRPATACERPGFRTAAIGPAGETLVLYATISNDGRHAGRGGLGAVLGAKRVKAVSVRGNVHAPIADPAGAIAAARDLSTRSLGPATAKYRELGTLANVLAFNRLSTLPAQNFGASSFVGASAISSEVLHSERFAGRESCAACTIGCEHLFRGRDGQGQRLEYESAFALGSSLGIEDADVVLEAARICDEVGIDTISAGGTLAMAMEAGIGGLRFGDGPAALAMLRNIATREGDGDLLAEGSRRAAAAIGRPELAMHVKGMEMPGYDPRRLRTMALGLAVGTRGADHNRSGAYEVDLGPEAEASLPERVARAVEIENRAAAMDSLILCKFLRGVFDDLPAELGELLALVTGRQLNMDETGAQICDLRKVFNEHCGWTRTDDALPERVAGAGDLDAAITTYYAARGWAEDGHVPPERSGQLLAGSATAAGRG